MTPETRARLLELERLARPLEPDAAARAALTDAVVERARATLARTPATAYATAPGAPAALAALGIQATPAPGALDRALAYLTDHVAQHGHTTWAPGFFGYIPGGNLYHAALGDYLAAVMNPFTGNIVASPGGVPIENQVLAWLASVVGYPASAVGNLTSGGSLANLGAVLAAREAAGIKSRDVPRTVVYLTEQTHHCVTKALRVAGLNECVLRHVPLDERYRMRADALDAAIAADRGDGLLPWLVVGSAGTTDTGAVDPLEAIAAIASRERLWFHVDAAYGGMFALCEEGKRILRGLERTDSLSLDPHKGMFLPYGTGAVLVKNREAMLEANSFEAHYVPDKTKIGVGLSPMEFSPELSRPFRGLRMWLPLQALGTAPFAAALEEKLLLGRYAWETLGAMERIEIGPPPDLSAFVFRVLPPAGAPADGAAIDALNVAVENAFLADGRVLLSSTVIGGRRHLRFCVLAIGTHREAIDLAARLLAEKIYLVTTTSR